MPVGVLGKNHQAGSWSARQIYGQVWTAAVERATLADPRVIPTVMMNKIRATLPLGGNLTVQSQLDEFEHAVTINAAPSGKDITLYKDRIRIGVSDESGIDSDVGDPLQLQKTQAAAELAGNLQTLIATSLAATPQVQATADWDTVSPLLTLGQMIQTLRPYQASAVVMAPTPYAQYVAALGNGIFSGGQTEDLQKGISIVPGYGIPVFPSNIWGDQSANSVAVVANDVPGAVLGMGPVKIREWDDYDLGSRMYQYDVWRTPVSNLRQTSANLNRGVITCVIT